MTPVRCADLSRAAGEELAGTGLVARRWLCVESDRQWGRDAVETGFADDVAGWLTALDAKVLAIRRPGRRDHVTVFAAETRPDGAELRRLELDDLAVLPDLDPWSAGEPHPGLLTLVCTHGRRDACCSRLGIPVYHAFDRLAGPDLVWQCSHTGGHRFAPNVVVLPLGVTLGRVDPMLAPELVVTLADGRVPLATYRGRSLYEAPVQAAEVAVRRARGLERLTDLALVSDDPGAPTFALGDGSLVRTRVDVVEGAPIVKSCGGEPEPGPGYRVTLL